MRPAFALMTACAVLIAVPAAAQLLPGVGVPQLPVVAPVTQGVEQTLDQTVGGPLETVHQTAGQLLRARTDRIADLLRARRQFVEPDAQGEPAVRGELLLVDPGEATLAAARSIGLTEAGSEQLGALDMTVVRMTLPRGLSLAEAQKQLLHQAPESQIAADNLHFQSGGAALEAAASSAAAGPAIATKVGIIDGGPGKGVAAAAVRGFAKGAPAPSDHGSAVASLLANAGARNLLMADVYGTDPAGGNALAIVRALDWLTGAGAKVVSISLVGPRNAALERAITAVRRKGVIVVAPVGNDGPAAPPAFPASYPGVLAVTGVDGRERPLIEAGHALHLDYAAPGADVRGLNKAGKWSSLRGTSYAVPLVAARAAAALERSGPWQLTLDQEAVDLGPKGPDAQYGRGLLCRGCGRR
jgi:hypothetical protein